MIAFRNRTRASDPSGLDVYDACGNACGATLIREKGGQPLDWVLQSNVAIQQGSILSTGSGLAAAMNTLQSQGWRAGQPVAVTPGGTWKGGQVDVWSAPRKTFNALGMHGSFMTSVRHPRTPIGVSNHMVIVDGFNTQGQVVIRDPADGTTYTMTWSSFRNIWQGDSVWWVPQ